MGGSRSPRPSARTAKSYSRAADQGDAEALAALADDPLADPPDEGVMAARMPFGPFLCLAIIEWMLGGDWIRDRLTFLG